MLKMESFNAQLERQCSDTGFSTFIYNVEFYILYAVDL